MIVEKRAEQEVLEQLQKGLLSGLTPDAARSVQIIHELVDLLGIDSECFRPLLEPFFVKGCVDFRAAVFREDWHWCHHFLELVEPSREIFLGYGLGEELRRSFRGFFFCAPTASFREAFVYLLRWKFPEILRDYIKQTRDPSLTGLLASVTVSYLQLENTAVEEYRELFNLLHESGWEELYSFFLLLEGKDEGSSVLEEHLGETLFSADPLTLYATKKEALYSVCRGMELMLSDLPGSASGDKIARQRFLEAVWSTTVKSGKHVIWREALTMLLELTETCRDPLIESEFFYLNERGAVFRFFNDLKGDCQFCFAQGQAPEGSGGLGRD